MERVLVLMNQPRIVLVHRVGLLLEVFSAKLCVNEELDQMDPKVLLEFGWQGL